MQESISEIWEKYFKSKGAGYAYVLLNTDGRTRANLLGINKRHYVNSVAANSWKNEIETALNSITDELPEEIIISAKAKLYALYSNMIESIGGVNNKDLCSDMRELASEMFTKARSLAFEHIVSGFNEELHNLLSNNDDTKGN